MEKVTILIGTVQSNASGTGTQDTTREVHFQGEKRGSNYNRDTGRYGVARLETLYAAEGNRLIVHVTESVGKYVPRPISYSLHEVTAADLRGDGRFADLGRRCGFGQITFDKPLPLTLDEALALGSDQENDD